MDDESNILVNSVCYGLLFLVFGSLVVVSFGVFFFVVIVMLLFWIGILVVFGLFIVIDLLVGFEFDLLDGLGISGVFLLKCVYKVILFVGIFIVLKFYFVLFIFVLYYLLKRKFCLVGVVGLLSKVLYVIVLFVIELFILKLVW